MQFQKVLGVGMDKGKRFVLDAAKNVVGTVKKQMSDMPSVFDFGFQTSQYCVPNDVVNGLTSYRQPNVGQSVTSTNRNVCPNQSFDEKEIHLTVNMTNAIDGRELAGATYTYTTELQERDRKRKEPFQGR